MPLLEAAGRFYFFIGINNINQALLPAAFGKNNASKENIFFCQFLGEKKKK